MEALQILNRIEEYGFECEAGPLKNCVDWQKLRASLSEAPREGWKLVPMEATTAMLELMNDDEYAPLIRYRAMLAAAPSPDRSEEQR